MDATKHILQLHGVEACERPVLPRKLRHREMIAFFERLPPTPIAMEACCASYHRARLLGAFGHEIQLIALQLEALRQARQERCLPTPKLCARR